MVAVTTARTRLRDAEHQVREVCDDARTVVDLVDGLAGPLREALGLSGMFVGATDPDTTVFATAGVVEGLDETSCAPWMHNEFLEDDFNKFAELHRDHRATTTLHRATQQRPGLSPRHVDINRPLGLGAEMRTTFSQDGACWGVANLLREEGRPDFDELEIAWLERLRAPVADAFRRTLTTIPHEVPGIAIPGVITLAPDGQLLAMSTSAGPLLEQLRGYLIEAGPGTRLPSEVYMVATLTRARASGREQVLRPVTRVQGRSGEWLTIRGDYTLDATGGLMNVVLVIEPARPSEIMPLVIASYGLTAREQEVLAELAAGRTSGEIATRLFISEHTVRDHVKSVLAKTGCSSRGEVLSKLFHDHALPVSSVTHA